MSERVDEILKYMYDADKPVYINGMIQDLKLETENGMNHGVFFLICSKLIELDKSKKFAVLSDFTRKTMDKQRSDNIGNV